MSDATIPENVSVSFPSLVNLAVEHWRLSRWLQAAGTSASAGPARHAVRKLEDFLKKHDLEAQSLDGRAFDPGLAAKVIDAVDDPALRPGQVVVSETLSPMILWQGHVVRPAEVVTAQGPQK